MLHSMSRYEARLPQSNNKMAPIYQWPGTWIDDGLRDAPPGTQWTWTTLTCVRGYSTEAILARKTSQVGQI